MRRKQFSAILTALAVLSGFAGCQGHVNTDQSVKITTVSNEQENENILLTGTYAEALSSELNTVIIAGREYDINETAVYLTGGVFTDDDLVELLKLKGLKELSVELEGDGCEITDLSIISRLKSLETLFIGGTYEDLSFIGDMPGLKKLELAGFVCDTVEIPVTNNITTLVLTETKIQSLDWLSNMNALTELQLGSHFICNDYSGIGNIAGLEILHMDMLEEYETDLSFLTNLKGLKEFRYCMPHGTVNFDCVSECTALEKIYIFDDIENFNFCDTLHSLREAVFYGTDKEYDLTPVANCTELQKLELYCGYSESSMTEIKRALPDCEIFSSGDMK